MSGMISPVFVLSQSSSSTQAELDELNKQIVDRQEKIKKLEASIDKYKAEMSKKRLEAVSLSNQMAILDNRIAQVEADIALTDEKIAILSLEIREIGIEIDQKKSSIDRQKDMLSEFLRTIQQHGNKNFVEVLATYNAVSEFYNSIQNLRTIETDIARSSRALKDAKLALTAKQEASQERKKSFEELKVSMDDKKLTLGEQIGAKQQLLGATQASELKYKTLVDNLRSQYQSIESEISSIEQQVRKKLDEMDRLGNANLGDPNVLSWPTQSRYITARFHDPDYPYRYVFEHNAIDIRASQGTAIKAASAGYIAQARRCSLASCYSYIMIVHSAGISTVYGHLSGITVNIDQFVTRGEIIGYSGGTPGTVGAGPFVTGPHLHFEVRKNGIPVDPLNYLVKDW